MKRLTYILAFALAIASCEKVIDIELNEADVQVVIEGKLYDEPQQSFIKITKSGDVYAQSNFEGVSGASVVVTDGVNTWNFTEDASSPGTYRDTSFLSQPNTTYNMTINNGTEVYTATSSTNSDVDFDSLDYIVSVGGFGQAEADTSFFTFFNFTDNGAEENYYRAIPYKNGEKSGTYYLTDDQLFNGNNFRQPFFASDFKSGDTLVAVLVSMDEANYTYFFTLANNQDGGPFSPTPGNPVSNIEGNAIGYFGVYMTGSEVLIYP